jgi:hypothetical protein
MNSWLALMCAVNIPETTAIIGSGDKQTFKRTPENGQISNTEAMKIVIMDVTKELDQRQLSKSVGRHTRSTRSKVAAITMEAVAVEQCLPAHSAFGKDVVAC